MLANIVDEKVHDLVHHSPRKCVKKTDPGHPEPVEDYPLKRDSEKGVRSNCGVIPWANCAAISPRTEANLKPWPLSPVISNVLSCGCG